MHCDWSSRVLYNSTRRAAYIWCVPYNSTYARKPSQSFLSLKILRRFFQTAIMAEEFPSFDLGFDSAVRLLLIRKRGLQMWRKRRKISFCWKFNSEKCQLTRLKRTADRQPCPRWFTAKCLAACSTPACTTHSVQINLNRPQEAKK